jgi:LacI family transcriptional regulator
MNTKIQKPNTAQALLENLDTLQEDLGKGGRKLARFFIDNPRSAALLSAGDVAGHCGVHASSVVRLAQAMGLSGYKEFQAILQQGLSPALAGQPEPSLPLGDAARSAKTLHLTLLVESGQSFNKAAQSAAEHCQRHDRSLRITTECVVPHTVDPSVFSKRIKLLAEDSDGLILVAREHPAINNAVRDVIRKGTPVICLTSDLPSSGRTAYVGSDQFASGATAGWLCGQFLPQNVAQKVLLVSSVPFRCQLDREQGFRQVLRSEFPSLTIDEKVNSDESPDITYDAIRRHIAKNGPPAAIYNVSGANLGIGRALQDENLVGKTRFLGHELNANSRKLLEDGIMDLTIGHDFDQEMSIAARGIQMALTGQTPANHLTQSQIFTRHNCTAS